MYVHGHFSAALASLVSVRGRVLFVLALGLALWKCWLAAMTQLYIIRGGKSERQGRRDYCHWTWFLGLLCLGSAPLILLVFLHVCSTETESAAWIKWVKKES